MGLRSSLLLLGQKGTMQDPEQQSIVMVNMSQLDSMHSCSSTARELQENNGSSIVKQCFKVKQGRGTR
jgi:hypothetical protein